MQLQDGRSDRCERELSTPSHPARLGPLIADRDQNRPRTKPGRCGKAGKPLIFCIFPGLSRFHAWRFSCVAFFLCLGGTDPARKRITRLRRLAARFLERAAMNSLRLAGRTIHAVHTGWGTFVHACSRGQKVPVQGQFAVAPGQLLGQERGGLVALFRRPSSRIAVFQCVLGPLVAQKSEMAVTADRLADSHKSFMPQRLGCVP